MIEPRTLKGFRDHLPAQALARERVLEIARRVYRSYGFAPIDTPALEYLEILTGKGSDETDKQLYRFQDHGGRDVGLRFDLTVPFARFAAQHVHELGLPFKRYHMAAVWRGENTQRGRYREFMQCDFDTIGTTSPVADLEMVLVVHDLLAAIGIERFTIRLNDRRALAGILGRLGLTDQATSVLRSLDKLGKATPEAVAAELAAHGVAAEAAAALLEMASLAGPPAEVLARLSTLVGD
jgi:histidyl-tRNA synthetase